MMISYLKGNRYTSRGGNSAKMVYLPSAKGSTVKGKQMLSSLEQILLQRAMI